MTQRTPFLSQLTWGLALIPIVLAVLALAVPSWRAGAEQAVAGLWNDSSPDESPIAVEPAEASSSETTHAVALSDQGLGNIGLDDDAIVELRLGEYERTISFPAVVVERPGRSSVNVPSPVSGVVARIHHVPGETIEAGDPLFDIQLNNEALIAKQADLIAALLQRDIVQQELDRLAPLGTDLAPKTRRDNEFKKAELDAVIEADRKTLQLYGLAPETIDATIVERRDMISSFTVCAPSAFEGDPEESHACHEAGAMLQIRSLDVEKGEQVAVGQTLCRVVDYCLLDIRGMAFASEEPRLADALENGREVRAVFEQADEAPRVFGDLRIRYIDNEVDPDSRTLGVYVGLCNEVESMRETDHGRFFTWRVKPGRRCQLELVADTIEDCFVLPPEAVARDNAEAYVFEWSGMDNGRKIWLRRPVRLLHQGLHEVAVANDGSIFPGARIASRGAGQLQVALDAGSGQLQSACPCGDH